MSSFTFGACRRDWRGFWILFVLTVGTGCVGPSTPFGALDVLGPNVNEKQHANRFQTTPSNVLVRNGAAPSAPPVVPVKPKILFSPDRQVLHQTTNLTIQLKNVKPQRSLERLKIYYNGLDVSSPSTWKTEKMNETKNSVTYKVRGLLFPANRYNKVDVLYKPHQGPAVRSMWAPPSCSIFGRRQVASVKPFSPPKDYLEWIRHYSESYQFNPSFTAGVIAQESSFNPRALSWAKALGLTQITPLAEREINSQFKSFPRFPKLHRMSYPRLKGMILTGKITKKQDWRLDPRLSIRGGLAYFQYLDQFWRQRKNAKVLSRLRGDSYVIYSQVLLASYNSGASRVRREIRRHGTEWLEARSLREAHKYVNRVFSYCYHFSDTSRSQETVAHWDGGGL